MDAARVAVALLSLVVGWLIVSGLAILASLIEWVIV